MYPTISIDGNTGIVCPSISTVIVRESARWWIGYQILVLGPAWCRYHQVGVHEGGLDSLVAGQIPYSLRLDIVGTYLHKFLR